MIDITAPIIPGQSAAGIRVGTAIDEVVQRLELDFTVEQIINPYVTLDPPAYRYRSAMVDLWVREGMIDQVMLHDGYRGKLMGKIGLGSTIADIEEMVGLWEEDEEDNLIIRGVPGLCFEVEGDFPDFADPVFRAAQVKAIFVYRM